ncbi:MAG: cell division protein FtsL [Alcaligenaceae bacterium]|nr:cell division protein FtsL [Alcaligenaceae bacterium]
MARLCVVVAVLLMLSAFSLVTAQFQARQLFVRAEALHNTVLSLDMDWRRLQLERAELSRKVRTDEIARRDLEMVNSTPARTLYLQVPGLIPLPQTGAAP